MSRYASALNGLAIATRDGIEKLTATDGSTVSVTGNRSFTKHARTYNLTVDELHTYYVPAGETPVLVHNSDGCPEAGPGWFPHGSGRIPSDWSGPDMARKYKKSPNKQGFVWRARQGQDSFRIDRGNPNSEWGSQ
ncbi:hypothetical protein AB0D86_47335 [Streptomyces sp. NPDC048324]|uniref:hypothetical protein n=1 Tax=Streptomyces sp. NPDC048324 TaxID=3157205 RepID=UPI003420FF46